MTDNGNRDSTVHPVHDDGERPSGGRIALVTGGSRGLGRALATRLVQDGWLVVIDGRDAAALAGAARTMAPREHVTALPGDVSDPSHRRHLFQALERLGGLDLLVNNASTLGPVPLRPVAETTPDELARVHEVNTVAPMALIRSALPFLRRASGRIINLSSDAAVQPYAGWGAYGSAKAALDQLSAVLAVEEPSLRVYAVDPGDMDTELHRAAVPDQNPDELPSPRSVVPHLLPLLDGDLPSGRYVASDLVAGMPA